MSFMAQKIPGIKVMVVAGVVAFIVNTIIIYGTYCKLSAYQAASYYSKSHYDQNPKNVLRYLSSGYLNKDTPIQVPVGPIPTVLSTFQESSRFSMSPDEDSNANWKTLFTNQFGIGFQHLGPYHFRFVSGAYHALHCLYSMHEDYEKPNHTTEPSHHFGHCLMYLRQVFLCNADTTLEDGDFLRKNLTSNRVGETRVCRDWTHVSTWVNDEFRRWAEYNGIKDF